MNELLFFKTIPRKVIWGKTVIKDFFNYDDYEDGVGQTWAFADQPDDLSNVCLNGPNKGKKLHEIWIEQPELFKSKFSKLPVIISLVGPSEDLSIQVHPDQSVAQTKGFQFGKNEAWYFINTEESSIVYDHNAENLADLVGRIKSQKWENLFKTVPVSDGDFIYIPAGTIHAMGKNNVVYEIQQATDLTYRIFDYDRMDVSGKKRPLHLNEAIESLVDNDSKDLMRPERKVVEYSNGKLTQFISNESFTVLKLDVSGEQTIRKQGYWLCTVIAGKGNVNGYNVRLGDNFISAFDDDQLCVKGNLSIMATSELGFNKNEGDGE